MSNRERYLMGLVGLVAVSLAGQRISKARKIQVDELEGQLAAARKRVEESRALMAAAPKVVEPERRPAALNDITMRILKDLTVPPELEDVKITAVDHTNATDYRMIVEGEFSGLMRFLSYLERPEGDFKVNHVDIARPPQAPVAQSEEGAPVKRTLKGTFSLSRRT
jgi:hypothetical protein